MFEELDKKLKKDPELRKHHQQEKLILDVTELIAKSKTRKKDVPALLNKVKKILCE